MRAHGLQLTAQQQGEAAGDVHVHAAVQAGGLQRHIGEGLLLAHQIGEGGGLEAEFTFGHQLQAMFGCGIAQVIGQQRVDHHAL